MSKLKSLATSEVLFSIKSSWCARLTPSWILLLLKSLLRENCTKYQSESKQGNKCLRFCLVIHFRLLSTSVFLFFFVYVENETLCPFWKGTGGVLLEVVSLIKRLESDRQEAKEALREERHKAQRLRRKQDSLSLWKQQQFPVAVQLGPCGNKLLRFV